jgi:hypothetical protein
MSCIDLTFDSDSESEVTLLLAVKPEPAARNPRSIPEGVIDLTCSPEPVVPMKANTSGKCLQLTDFYPSSPNKKVLTV